MGTGGFHKEWVRGRGYVAIVDDDVHSAGMLEAAVRRCGVGTITIGDGAIAHRILRARSDIFLALINWMLPSQDGHAICRTLAETNPEIMTVLMLGRPFFSAEFFGNSKAAGFLGKPFSESDLDDQIAVLLGVAWARRHGNA